MLGSLTLLGSLGELVEKLLKGYKKAHKGKLGTMRAVLTEMHLNFERMDDFFEMKNPIRQVIDTLSVKSLKAALFDSDFDFNSFEHKSIQPRKLIPQPDSFYLNYEGWSTERMFNNLYEKMARLQEINTQYGDNPHYRLNVRLDNIRKMMLLLLMHLRDAH